MLLSWYKPECLEVRSKGKKTGPGPLDRRAPGRDPTPGTRSAVLHLSAGPRSPWSAPAPTGRTRRPRGRVEWDASGVSAPPGGHLGRLLGALCRARKMTRTRPLCCCLCLSRQCLAPKRLVETPEAKGGPVRLGDVVEQSSSRARLPGYQSFICHCDLGKCLHLSVPSLFMGIVDSMHV